MSRSAFATFVLLLQGAPLFAGEPLTLADAVRLALGHSAEVAVAVASEGEQRAALRAARDLSRPEAVIGTTPGWASGLPPGQLPSVAGLALRQSLYDPDRRAGALEEEARWATARGGVTKAREQAAHRVAVLYVRCLTGEKVAAAARLRETMLGQAARHAEALAAEGRLTELDVDRAGLAEARARQARLAAESDSDLDGLELRRLLGLPGSEPLVLAEEPLDPPKAPDIPDLDRALASDPELLALGEASRSLTGVLKVREHLVAPTVAAEARYDRVYRTSDYQSYYQAFRPDQWSVGLSITIPLFSAGRMEAAEARARAAVDRVGAERRARVLEIELAVHRAEEAVGLAAARRSLEYRAMDVAREEARVARALSEEGKLGIIEADSRDAALADAEEAAARAESALLLARLDLLALRGDLAAALVAT